MTLPTEVVQDMTALYNPSAYAKNNNYGQDLSVTDWHSFIDRLPLYLERMNSIRVKWVAQATLHSIDVATYTTSLDKIAADAPAATGSPRTRHVALHSQILTTSRALNKMIAYVTDRRIQATADWGERTLPQSVHRGITAAKLQLLADIPQKPQSVSSFFMDRECSQLLEYMNEVYVPKIMVWNDTFSWQQQFGGCGTQTLIEGRLI